MTSASAARARASSAKQSRPDGHRNAPGHSRAVVDTMAQARKWGSKGSSARSPVVVSPAHRTRLRTWSAMVAGSDGVGPGTWGQGVVGVRRVGRPGGQGELAGRAADLGHPLAADVVAPSLQHGEGQIRHRWPPATSGQILVGQLVLEGLGGRGHHHPFAGQGGGHQVGERLAGAGAGLDDQMAPAGHRSGHRDGHLDLARTGLAAPGQAGGHPRQGGGRPRRASADTTGRFRRPGMVGGSAQCHSTARTTATPTPTTTMHIRRASVGSRRP